MTATPYENLTGSLVLDVQGRTAGTVSQVYVSDATGQAGWVLLETGAEDGGRFAPLGESQVRGGQLVLAVTAQMISDAPWPALDSSGRLPAASAETLARHYSRAATDLSQGAGTGPPGGGLVVSEERLHVGTERVVSGRARLVKYTVTEEVTLTVLVAREEVRVELEPAAPDEDEPGAGAGEGISSAGNAGSAAGGWMILRAQRPVVQLESVPVERVRLRVETVTGQQEITSQVRKERVGSPEVEALPPAAPDRLQPS